MGATRPNTYGGSISVSDSQSLANLNVDGLPPGTTVWNEDVGAFFKLTTCARRVITLDPTDAYDSGVWTFADGNFTENDEEDTLVVRLDYPNAGYNANYFIVSVDSATEITVSPEPADASTFPLVGAVTVVDTGPSEADVVVAVQGGAVFGVVWRLVEGGGGTGDVDTVTAQTANAVDNTDPANPIVLNATGANAGTMSAANFSKLAALPDAWITVPVPSDTADVVLSTTLDGDVDLGYEVDFVCAATTDLAATVYTLNVALNGGAAAATGSLGISNFGNGTVTASEGNSLLKFTDKANAVTGQNPQGRCILEAAQTGLPRKFISVGSRGPVTNGATWSTVGQYTAGTGVAATNITGLTLHASTAAGFVAGSLVRYRKLRS